MKNMIKHDSSSALPSLPSFHLGGNALCFEQMTRAGLNHCHMVVHADIAWGRADSCNPKEVDQSITCDWKSDRVMVRTHDCHTASGSCVTATIAYKDD